MANVEPAKKGENVGTAAVDYCYEERASCCSKLTLGWFTTVMIKARKKTLEEDDIGKLHSADGCEKMQTKLMGLWHEEIEKKGLENASLIPVWFSFIGFDLLFKLLLVQVAEATCQLATPALTSQLLLYLEGSNPLTNVELVLIVIGLSIAPMLQGFCRGTVMFRAKRASLRAYGALTTAVYRKALRLSAAGKADAETGQILNIMSADANNSQERSVFMLLPVIIGPFQIVICLVLIANTIGWSMLAAFIFLLIATPININTFKQVASWYRESTKRGDGRVKLVNELISGIRIIKFYAWEKPMVALIEKAREYELDAITHHAYWVQMGMMAAFQSMPQLMQLFVFTAYFFLDGNMKASTVFVTIQLFDVLRIPVAQMPNGLSQIASTFVGLRRIQGFLKRDEVKVAKGDTFDTTPIADTSEPCIEIKDGLFGWKVTTQTSANEKPKSSKNIDGRKENYKKGEEDAVENKEDDTEIWQLKDINVSINPGQLIMISGAVGSGKSSFLRVLMNEIIKVNGNVTVRGNVSYVGQQAWIANATMRENILFGSEYDEARYRETIRVSGLEPDLKSFASGDQLMIGERGINLSGGQKARVGMARCVYNPSSIVLMDSPLAAVDSHVGDHIFNECILGYLKERTRILVTNQLHRLKNADHVIYLANGKIAAQGTYDDIVKANVVSLDEETEVATKADKNRKVSEVDEEEIPEINAAATTKDKVSEVREGEEKSGKMVLGKKNTQGGTLANEEERAIGHVGFSTWLYFFRTAGLCFALFSIICMSSFIYIQVGANFTLGLWTDDVQANGPNKERDGLYLGVYATIMAVMVAAMMGGGYLMASVRLRVARRLHKNMLNMIVLAPISFFDVTPLGRIMNRFSKEQNQVDMMMTVFVSWAFVTMAIVMASFLAISIATYGLFLFLLLPVAFLYIQMYQFVSHTSIEVQRLESNFRSPLYAAFSEVLNGVETIRAFDQTGRFQETHRLMLNRQMHPFFLARTCIGAWMVMRCNLLGGTVVLGIASLVVSVPNLLPAGLVGLALTYSIQATQYMFITVFCLTEAEIMMNAVEKIKYYSDNIPQEAALTSSNPPPKSWPSKGVIEIENLRAGYRDGPDVLKGVSISIKEKEKIGIVGRTGSGKSSLLVTLFRIIEPRGGKIIIDGIDISTIGLEELRMTLGIIPQDPILFSGTLRHNLDPFSLYTDLQLWEAIEKVDLLTVIKALPGKLEEHVSEGGKNFSVGQRQLMCMARALLRDPKVLLLDEATAAVDRDTDAFLQKMIRKCFADKTVLTIAHRLDTIMDSDRVLVLDFGNVAEWDTPKNLSKIDNGLFRALVYAEGEENGDRLMKLIQ
jgi:ABC-type multidrug transport system fused ATPase/permease subunit